MISTTFGLDRLQFYETFFADKVVSQESFPTGPFTNITYHSSPNGFLCTRYGRDGLDTIDQGSWTLIRA